MKEQTVGKMLQKKADEAKDKKIQDSLIAADISGLSREAAKEKLNSIIDKISKQ